MPANLQLKRMIVVLVAVCQLATGTVVQAVETAPIARPGAANLVFDAALDDSGHLHGTVIDRLGVPQKETRVVATSNQAYGTTVTDKNGRFRLRLDRGGVFQVQASHAQGMYRIWSAKAAPPTAQKSILITQSPLVVRGQQTPAYAWISEHPWAFYSILATAIVVPIVIVSADDDSSS